MAVLGKLPGVARANGTACPPPRTHAVSAEVGRPAREPPAVSNHLHEMQAGGGKKTGLLRFTACNYRSTDQIGTKLAQVNVISNRDSSAPFLAHPVRVFS